MSCGPKGLGNSLQFCEVGFWVGYGQQRSFAGGCWFSAPQPACCLAVVTANCHILFDKRFQTICQ